MNITTPDTSSAIPTTRHSVLRNLAPAPHYAFYRAITMNHLLNPTERIIAIYLLTRMNGGKAWPSVALIEKEVGLSRSVVLSSTKTLRHQRIIHAQNRGGKSSIYSLTEEFVSSVDAAWASGRFDETIWIGTYQPPALTDAPTVNTVSERAAPKPPEEEKSSAAVDNLHKVRDSGPSRSGIPDPEVREEKEEKSRGPQHGVREPGSGGQPGVPAAGQTSGILSLSSQKKNVGENSIRSAVRQSLGTDEPESASRARLVSSEDRALALFFLDKIKEVAPSAKLSAKWVDTIRLMRERDGHSHDEIRAMFLWANDHDFWRTNILSPATLRRQWVKLEAQRNQPANIQWPDPSDENAWHALGDRFNLQPNKAETWRSYQQRIRQAARHGNGAAHNGH